MISDLLILCVRPSTSIREAIALIDRNSCGIVLVVDEEYRLLDTVTDGDVRRVLLDGLNLDSYVSLLRDYKAGSPYPEPVTALVGTEASALLRLMQEQSVRQLPLLDGGQRVVGLVTLNELLPMQILPVQAVVMAGGLGLRMRPLTEELPKPMLPVGERPLLERIVHQLRDAGVRQVIVSTHYKGDVISSHFGDGKEFGVEISYLHEDQPLGTAGALSLLDASEDPLLVINGDILTRLDFRAMLDFHRDHQADMTVAVCLYELRVPYGVVETNGVKITAISEKPAVRQFINGGVYLLNRDVCRYIPAGRPFDMPDLILGLLEEGRQVISFPVREYWLDIGESSDYEQAKKDLETGKV